MFVGHVRLIKHSLMLEVFAVERGIRGGLAYPPAGSGSFSYS